MKEFNWREEREKYQPEFNRRTQSADAAPVVQAVLPEKKKTGRWIVGGLITAVVLAAAAVVFAINYYGGDSSEKLAEAAAKYERAVGITVLTVELKNGNKLPIPIGSAWAFAENRFATNAHVAYGLKEAVTAVIASGVESQVTEIAKQNNCATAEEFLKKLKPEQAAELVAAAEKNVRSMISKVRVDLIINGSRKESLAVKSVQIHREYGVVGSKFNPDVAVLVVDGKHDCFFEIAADEKLHQLKSGDPIAFLGFPTEGLAGGNVNIDNPVASMQSGIIVAVSDFEMKDAGAAGNHLIRHNLPATGGASGSVIFDQDGEVVALLFAGNVVGQVNLGSGTLNRAPSAAQINFAIRADLLDNMGDEIPIDTFLNK